MSVRIKLMRPSHILFANQSCEYDSGEIIQHFIYTASLCGPKEIRATIEHNYWKLNHSFPSLVRKSGRNCIGYTLVGKTTCIGFILGHDSQDFQAVLTHLEEPGWRSCITLLAAKPASWISTEDRGPSFLFEPFTKPETSNCAPTMLWRVPSAPCSTNRINESRALQEDRLGVSESSW